MISHTPIPRRALSPNSGGVDLSAPLCYSMDEVRNFCNMDNDKAAQEVGTPEGFQLPLPLHYKLEGKSEYEVKDGDTHWYDPQTAHARAGDTGFEIRLPETCGLCKATALAEAAARSVSGSDQTEAS